MKQTLLVANLMLSAALLATAQKTPESMLGAALHQEEVQGDLKGAIAAYQKVAATAGVNRKTAAEALVRVGQCYEKLGDSESRKAYERVVRDYADQKEAAALARARLGGDVAARNVGPAIRRVWTLPPKGEIYSGTVSRDGRYVAYVSWAQEHHGDLFLHDFTTGADRRLTNTAGPGSPSPKDQFAEEYSFSRDGKQLVYTWFDGKKDRYELRVIDLQATGIPQFRRLFDSENVFWIAPDDWSPDGKSIAVRIQQTRTDKTAQIGLVSVPEGSLRVLKSVDWRGALRIFFSPDGKYLGYDLPESDISQQRDVFVLAIDGTREFPAIVHRGEDKMMGWSPDGKRLLFASDRTGSMGLWGLPFADGKPRGEPELIKGDIGRAESIGLTRSGALYLNLRTGFSTHSNIQVASFDFDAGKLLSSPADVTPEYLESHSSPSWSPDGKYLAHLSERGRTGSANTFLVIRSAETSQVVRELRVQLTGLNGVGWAGDGRSLLFQGRDFKGRWGTFRMDAQNGDLSPLIFHERRDLSYPTLSPDGKMLYFSRRISGGKEFALIQRDLVSGNEKEMMRRPFVVADRVSPDGRYLAPSSVDPSTNSRTKLLIPASGGEPREIMRVPTGVEPEALTNYNKGIGLIGARWAPDSRSFLTTKRFNDGKHSEEAWRVPLDGGVPIKIDLDGVSGVRLHPDGRRITYAVVGTQWASDSHSFFTTKRFNDEKHSEEVWRVPLDGGVPIKLDLGEVSGFQLHPDGRRIAYTVAETGLPRKQEVWVLENFLHTTRASK